MNNFEEKLNKYAEVIVKIGANVQKGQKVWVNWLIKRERVMFMLN